MADLSKIIDTLEEVQEMLDEAAGEASIAYLKAQINMANGNCKGAIQNLREAIRTQTELSKAGTEA